MTQYYMTSKRNNEVGYWILCRATTILGAKRECTRVLGDGYLDSLLFIGVKDSPTHDIQAIAYKPIDSRVWNNWYA